MPQLIEFDGKEIKVWTESEVQAAIDDEVKGLKITNQNLKDEKEAEKTKAQEAKEAVRVAQEAEAKAKGDNETLQRLADEREAEKQSEINNLIASVRNEKTGNALGDLITKLGAGGQKNEDLRDLIKSRYGFDYDIESQSVKVTGDGVTTIAELEKAITSSGRYDNYLAATQASGGGASGGGSGGPAPTKKYAEMTTAERSQFFRDDPVEAQKQSDEYEKGKM